MKLQQVKLEGIWGGGGFITTKQIEFYPEENLETMNFKQKRDIAVF